MKTRLSVCLSSAFCLVVLAAVAIGASSNSNMVRHPESAVPGQLIRITVNAPEIEKYGFVAAVVELNIVNKNTGDVHTLTTTALVPDGQYASALPYRMSQDLPWGMRVDGKRKATMFVMVPNWINGMYETETCTSLKLVLYELDRERLVQERDDLYSSHTLYQQDIKLTAPIPSGAELKHQAEQANLTP